MFGECRDHRPPTLVILRRSDDGLVPKCLASVRRGQLPWHKAQFHERAHVILEQAIVNLVDVGKIVGGLTAGVFVIHADFVMEDGVEANVFEIGGSLHLAQVAPIAVAQTENGTPRSEHLFPEMWKWMGGTVDVNLYGLPRGCALRMDDRRMQRNEDNRQHQMDSKGFHLRSARIGVL